METWFLLAVLSAVTGGFNAFLHKIVAEWELDSYTVTFYGAFAASILLCVGNTIFGTWSGLLQAAFLFAVIWGVLFSATLVLKVESLRYIDSAIFFPLYKTISPVFVIIGGVLIFSETFSLLEWIGLAIGVLVPLMLVSKAEKYRQKNLIRGLVLLVIGASIAAIAAFFQNYGIKITDNALLYTTVCQCAITLGALFLLLQKHRAESLVQLSEISISKKLQSVTLMTGVSSVGAFSLGIYALHLGGPLSIVYTINSLYILIPIVLSIIFYNEHWNLRKVIAIVLSIAALGLLG